MLASLEPRQRPRPRPKIKPRRQKSVSDEARFFRGWLQRPLLMGAVSPSSKALGRAMAAFVPDPAGWNGPCCVLELGPGTGVVTQCLVDRRIPESALVLVEYSPEFCALLRARFPAATVIQGDAYNPGAALDAAVAGRRRVATISSLPLFTKPDEKRERVIARALGAMDEGAPFVQFSYALTVPVKPMKIGARLTTGPWIKRNLPPARVLVYRAA